VIFIHVDFTFLKYLQVTVFQIEAFKNFYMLDFLGKFEQLKNI